MALNDELGAPKPARIVNPEAIDFVRNKRDGYCLVGLALSGQYGPCGGTGLHVHHIDTRGSGGDDIPEDLITLCPGHHNKAHLGQIAKTVMRGLLIRYFQYEYEEPKEETGYASGTHYSTGRIA